MAIYGRDRSGSTLGLLIVGASGWAALIPFMVIGLPRIYGCWHMVLTRVPQHGGLAEDVLDHRLNTRTVYMNPVSRWIYWNMNYHVEHHMFPMVPYYKRCPRLHETIKHDLPRPNASMWEAYKEMWAAILRQRREPGYYLRRDLPPTAKPYREDLHDAQAVPERASA
jgi:fatty acid desaturase